MQTAGFVLAGGHSRRMGRDKALLPHPESGVTMLEHACELLREVVGNATVLGPASRYGHLGLAILEDEIPECGPLGGLYTALRHAERILVIPVDLPKLTAEFLRRVLALDGPCTLAAGQPLVGVYTREACLPAITEALLARRLRVTAVVAALSAREVVPDDLQVLQNRNTPEDCVY